MYALVVLMLLLWQVSVAWSAAYYVSTTGDDCNCCSAATNATTAKRSVGGNAGSTCGNGCPNAGGISCMASGDTLIVKDGVYVESPIRQASNIPSGTSSQQTVIKAENPRGAEFRPNSTSQGHS